MPVPGAITTPSCSNRFGRDMGADIPGPVNYVDGLRGVARPVRQRRSLPARRVHPRRVDVHPRTRPAGRALPGHEPRPAVVVPRQRRRNAALPPVGDRDGRLRQHDRLRRRHPRVPVDPGPPRRRPACRLSLPRRAGQRPSPRTGRRPRHRSRTHRRPAPPRLQSRARERSVPRLADATIGLVDADRPRYDRSSIRPGIVHIGLGAFARAHLAVYIDDLLAAGHNRSRHHRRVAPPRRHRSARSSLRTGSTRSASSTATTTTHRVIGSIHTVLHAPSQRRGPSCARRSADDATRHGDRDREGLLLGTRSTRSLDTTLARRRSTTSPTRTNPDSFLAISCSPLATGAARRRRRCTVVSLDNLHGQREHAALAW